MNVTFSCPHCDQTSTVAIHTGDAQLDCPRCHTSVSSAAGAWSGEELHNCLVCGSQDLFIRKDFPHRLGLTIVVLGFAASCVFWYLYWTYLTFAALFIPALADLALYFIVGDSLVCYRCQAEYRELPLMEEHGPFSLETHERYRQQSARLAAVRGVPDASHSEIPRENNAARGN